MGFYLEIEFYTKRYFYRQTTLFWNYSSWIGTFLHIVGVTKSSTRIFMQTPWNKFWFSFQNFSQDGKKILACCRYHDKHKTKWQPHKRAVRKWLSRCYFAQNSYNDRLLFFEGGVALNLWFNFSSWSFLAFYWVDFPHVGPTGSARLLEPVLLREGPFKTRDGLQRLPVYIKQCFRNSWISHTKNFSPLFFLQWQNVPLHQ